jgi:predicted GIY-YIG superfamily endonuclease
MFYIYVLLCTDDKYYIGKTTNSVEARYEQHLSDDNSCAFTSKYKPVKIIEVFNTDDLFEEDKITKIYMMKHGIQNVRGGSYTTLELEDWQIKSLEHEFVSLSDLCYKCKKSGHFAKDCNIDNDKLEIYFEKFNSIEEISQEITRITSLYDEIQKLNEEISNTDQLYALDIDIIKEVAIASKKQEEYRKKSNTIYTKMTNDQLSSYSRKIDAAQKKYNMAKKKLDDEYKEYGASNGFSQGNGGNAHIMTVINSWYGEYGKNKNYIKYKCYDIMFLELLNFNHERKMELKSIEQTCGENIDKKLIGLYEKKIKIMETLEQ